MLERDPDRDQLESGDLDLLTSAVSELSGHVRQIKIVILVYAIVSDLVSVASWLASSRVLDFSDDTPTESSGIPSDPTFQESEALSQGDPLPAISVTDANGRVWSNSDFEGRLVVLNLWATWCPPCREEMPLLNEMQQRYWDRGLIVIGISLDDEGWEVVRPFIDDMGLNFPVAVADAGVERGFGSVTSLPTTYFVHRNGIVHSKKTGLMTRTLLTAVIEGLLEQDPPAESETDSASEHPAAPASEVEQVFKVGTEVSSPRLLYKVEPEYSEKARKAKFEGTVLLGVEVWEDGMAHNIRILRGVGLGLDESAVEAVRQWKFSPGEKDGKPVRVAAQIQVSFRLL